MTDLKSNNKLYKITNSDFTIAEMSKRDYLTSEISDAIKKANILLVPNETYTNYPIFPEDTRSFFKYLKENTQESKIVIDICISDENYKELEMHDATVILSSIIVQEPFCTIITNLISNYLYDLIKRTGEKSLNLKTDIILEKYGESRKIHYDGPASEFDKTIKSIKKNILW